jgi:hypothetical protein
LNEFEDGIAISTNDDVDLAELNGAWNKGWIVGSDGFGPNTCSRFRVPETNLRFRQERQCRLSMVYGEGEQVLRISTVLKSDGLDLLLLQLQGYHSWVLGPGRKLRDNRLMRPHSTRQQPKLLDLRSATREGDMSKEIRSRVVTVPRGGDFEYRD